MDQTRGPRPTLLLLIAGLLAATGCPSSKPVSGTVKTSSSPSTTPTHPHLRFGVVSANIKVRPKQRPATTAQAMLRAARNELEAFQIVFTASQQVAGVSLALSKTLTGPSGATIPARNVVFYRVGYYQVGTASNLEGAAGRWPDPLIPDVDTYVGEKRNAFPFVVPRNESRVVWTELLVPRDAKAGRYQGEIQVRVNSKVVGKVPLSLQVGRFTLPSTASLRSAFDMDYAQPCMAHMGNDTCAPKWDPTAAYTLRERYVRAGLEHRFSIFNIFFQPPFDSPAFDKHMMPLVRGTGRTRLAGAKVTAVRLDATEQLDKWIAYAKARGFFDRLVHYPIDEPGDDAAEWDEFKRQAKRLHQLDPKARILMTASIQETDKAGATELVDWFVPVINSLEDRPDSGSIFAGNQLPKYQTWLNTKPGRELWAYQSCMSHGCGACGEPSPEKGDTGWPNRVIDSSAVQNRAIPWIAFRFNLSGELYFEVAEQLNKAWLANGQCKFSGSGDGTLFYPGTPATIGGKTHIPIESIRIKLIREGMEDYEYLTLLARRDSAAARAIAASLFARAYDCAQPAAKLEAARNKLFELLDR